MQFIFKGGTSLLLHMPQVRRLSRDIDNVCGRPAAELDAVVRVIGSATRSWVKGGYRLYIPFRRANMLLNAGGTVAGNARRDLEQKSGCKVVTSENYLALTQSVKKAKSLAKPAPPGKPGKP